MRIAVISLTGQGRVLSERIAALLPGAQRYCFHKYADAGAEAFDDLPALTAALFPQCRALIFVGACGIAVRMIAPHLRTKQTDPAVLAVDGNGRFVIPLLSGHIGGANALAVKLAEGLGAQAVITTGTDIGGVFSPDSFAAANHLLLTDFAAAKELAAAALHGEEIGLSSEYPCRHLPPEITESSTARIGMYIGTQARTPYPVTLQLTPQNIVLGIGCRRGTGAADIALAVERAFRTAALSEKRICAAATIDRKADEPGLLAFCESRGIPLVTYTAQELMQTEGTFSSSEFVQEITGADNVCERSAVRCSGGELLVHKTARGGVTVAAAERPVILDFERKIL